MTSDDYRSFSKEEWSLQEERLAIDRQRQIEQWKAQREASRRKKDNRMRKARSGRRDLWSEHLSAYPLPRGYRVVPATELTQLVRRRQTAALQKANERRQAMHDAQEVGRKQVEDEPETAQVRSWGTLADLERPRRRPEWMIRSERFVEEMARKKSSTATASTEGLGTMLAELRPGRLRNHPYDNRSTFYGDGRDHIDDMDMDIGDCD